MTLSTKSQTYSLLLPQIPLLFPLLFFYFLGVHAQHKEPLKYLVFSFLFIQVSIIKNLQTTSSMPFHSVLTTLVFTDFFVFLINPKISTNI